MLHGQNEKNKKSLKLELKLVVIGRNFASGKQQIPSTACHSARSCVSQTIIQEEPGDWAETLLEINEC
jgi:hypothetical protein